MAISDTAPSYSVPVREIVALEHPMIIKNIDKGLKTLGTGVPPRQVSGLRIFAIVPSTLVLPPYNRRLLFCFHITSKVIEW